MKLPKELKEKSDLRGATSKGKKCSVKGCSELAVRSLPENKWKSYVEKAKLRYNENKQNKIYLLIIWLIIELGHVNNLV